MHHILWKLLHLKKDYSLLPLHASLHANPYIAHIAPSTGVGNHETYSALLAQCSGKTHLTVAYQKKQSQFA